MERDPSAEPPIDVSLSHYMEQRALEIALERASSEIERAKVKRLMDLRTVIMAQRATHHKEATEKRHARGEVYSSSRVAAINAMGSNKRQLDETIKSLYPRQSSTVEVLKTYAMTHFAYGLLSSRTMLSLCPPDILDSARAMQEHEEAFAAAWLHEIDDAKFNAQLRELRRDAFKILRSSSQPIYLCTQPKSNELSETDAQTLGKAWSKLDSIAQSLMIQPLSNFMALPTENENAGTAANEILLTVEKLLEALNNGATKIASKRAVVAALTNVKAALSGADTAYFEIDI